MSIVKELQTKATRDTPIAEQSEFITVYIKEKDMVQGATRPPVRKCQKGLLQNLTLGKSWDGPRKSDFAHDGILSGSGTIL